MRAHHGFTIIELMVVVVIIAIIAAISVPNVLSARVAANESAALATLRTVTSAQSQIQAGSYVDVDGDGAGEYGYFRELSGATGVRTAGDGSAVGRSVAPAILSGSFGRLSATGIVSRSGYLFRMVLPAADGSAVTETATGPLSGTTDANLCEIVWGAMAWPSNNGTTGIRSFFVNQQGDTLATEAPEYTGPSPGLYAGAAFRQPGAISHITGRLAIGTFGRDGNLWKRVN